MAKKKLTAADKQALKEWEQLVKDIRNETSISEDLSAVDKDKMRRELEADAVKWILYFFPKTATYPFAPFHIAFIKRIVENAEWYDVISWARELAKSSVVRMVVLYLIMTGKLRYTLLVSATQDSAIRLLRPYKAQIEANQRLIYFYGEQKGLTWTEDELILKTGAAIRALGYGNKPRGSQNDDTRPDCIIPDDFDTDEDCRNEETLQKKWEWFEKALYFTRSWSEPLRVIWCGNIIAEDCCIVRAGTKALELAAREKPLGNWDIINIRMVDINNPDPVNDYLYGTSVWPAKNSEELIDIVLAKVSSSAAQAECFNNPVTVGSIFKEMRWGAVPPLKDFKFLIVYGDPAPSNEVKKKSRKASYKATFLMGIHGGKLYVITGYLDRVVNDEFIRWFYALDRYVAGKTQVYNYIENNKLQNPFFQQVFKPLWTKLKTTYKKTINLIADERAKPDKAVRIDGNLEPLNRDGNLILNIEEKDNPHMKRLEGQFKTFNLQLTAPADGPDCIEGGYWKANEKMSMLTVNDIQTFGAVRNNKRV